MKQVSIRFTTDELTKIRKLAKFLELTVKDFMKSILVDIVPECNTPIADSPLLEKYRLFIKIKKTDKSALYKKYSLDEIEKVLDNERGRISFLKRCDLGDLRNIKR